MKEEIDELQVILERSPNLPSSDPRAERKRRKDAASQKGIPPAPNGYGLSYTQWTMEPNDSFVPTGDVKKTIPAGMYEVDVDDHGRPHFRKLILASDTLIDLDDQGGKRAIQSIRTFWTKREVYRDHGILYKRGILMWGPAGSGKTATLTLLIKELIDNMGGIVLPLRNPDNLIVGLKALRRIEPERNLIIVMEDIEEIINTHGEHELLSVLDGEHQVDNVVSLATTNYPEQLGARIINRPSRFDEVIKIGMPSKSMRRTYFEYLTELTGQDLEKWVNDTGGLSIAHLRELVVAVSYLDRTYEETLQRLKSMRVQPKSSMLSDGAGFTSPNLAGDYDDEDENQ
jgi:hypothetical protein